MSIQCLCFTDFPPRDFQRVRDADEFSTRVRFSTNFLQLDKEGLRFGCRRCGQAWGFRMEGPPFLWRPEGRTDAPAAETEHAPLKWRRRH